MRSASSRGIGYLSENEVSLPRGFPPVPVDRLQHELDTGRERDEPIGARADRTLLEPFVADLLDVFLGHDPPGAGRARVEREEIGPRRLQAKANTVRAGGLDRGDPLLERLVGGAPVAVE